MSANLTRILTNPIEMKVSDQTDLSHMAGLPAESIIEAAAIIKVEAIIRMAIGLHATPRGATSILDTDEVILDEGPIPGILPTHVCPGDIPTGPDLCPDPIGDADPILAAKPDPDLMEGVAIVLGVTTVRDPQTAMAPSKIPGHQGRTDDLPSKPSNARPMLKVRQLEAVPSKPGSHLQTRLPKDFLFLVIEHLIL